MMVLDSNTLIFYFRGIEPVVRRFQSVAPRDLRIPSIVAYEIQYGALQSGSARRREIAKEVLGGISQIPFDAAAASDAALIRIELERQGRVIGSLDLMIAGSARSRGAVLVTSNTKEFSRVADLALQDWTT